MEGLPVMQLLLLVVMTTAVSASSMPLINRDNVGEKNQMVKVGESIVLNCQAEKNPSTIVTWKKGDEAITRGWLRFKMAKVGLKIKDVEVEDAGVYICEANNGFDLDQLQYNLYVTDNDSFTFPPVQHGPQDKDPDAGKPKFKYPERLFAHKTVAVDSDVRLKCVPVDEKPEPTIVWYKDDELLQSGGEAYEPGQKYPDDARWSLKLQNLRTSDTGTYKCRVTNSKGYIQHSYYLDVPDRLPKPEIRDPHPLNETVDYGETASFQCRVHSQVPPKIQWLKRVDSKADIYRKNQTIEVEGQYYVVLQSSDVVRQEEGVYINKLVIKKVRKSDAGKYICLGVNSMGTSLKDAFLTVIGGEQTDYAQSPYGRGSEPPKLSLILIIAVPCLVVVVVVSIAIYCLCKKSYGAAFNNSQKNITAGNQANKNGQQVALNMSGSAAGSSSAGSRNSKSHDKHYYTAVPPSAHPQYQQQHNGAVMYQQAMPQPRHLPYHDYHQHNSSSGESSGCKKGYPTNGNVGMYNPNPDYPPMLHSNNLPPANLNHHHHHLPHPPSDMLRKNYGEMHSDASSGVSAGPHNTTPLNSNSSVSGVSSNTYMPPPVHTGGMRLTQYPVT